MPPGSASPRIAAGSARQNRRARGVGRERALRCRARAAASRSPPETTERRSISTKAPVKGRSDQSGSAVTWNRISSPRPMRARGDQRRAVFQARPGEAVEFGGGLREHLLANGGVGRLRDAEEGRVSCRSRRCRCGVSQDSDEPSEREVGRSGDGRQRIVLGGEARAGKADQHAAFFDPCRSGVVAHRPHRSCRDRP